MARKSRAKSDHMTAEVSALGDALDEAMRRAAGAPPAEMDIWRVYADSERATAKLKLRLKVERPGLFSELPRSKTPAEFLVKAQERMRAAGDLIKSEKRGECLQALREGRTFLRAYLAELGRVRSREKRRAALSRRASSPSS